MIDLKAEIKKIFSDHELVDTLGFDWADGLGESFELLAQRYRDEGLEELIKKQKEEQEKQAAKENEWHGPTGEWE